MNRNPDDWISNLHNHRRAGERELELLDVIKKGIKNKKKAEARIGMCGLLRFCLSALAKQVLGASNEAAAGLNNMRGLSTFKTALYIDIRWFKGKSILSFAGGKHAFKAVNIC